MFRADRTATVNVGCSGILTWIVLIISSTYDATFFVNSSLSPRSGYSEPKILTRMLFLSDVIVSDAMVLSGNGTASCECMPQQLESLQIRLEFSQKLLDSLCERFPLTIRKERCPGSRGSPGFCSHFP